MYDAVMAFPTTDSTTNFANILAYLGWNTTYTVPDLATAVNTCLQGSTVPAADQPAVHDNFIHTAISHSDMMMGYYGAKVTFGLAADGITPTVTFNAYP